MRVPNAKLFSNLVRFCGKSFFLWDEKIRNNKNKNKMHCNAIIAVTKDKEMNLIVLLSRSCERWSSTVFGEN